MLKYFHYIEVFETIWKVAQSMRQTDWNGV